MTYAASYVTETDEAPPWIDCAWATGSMWLDKGFAGALPLVDKDVLRAKSGDTEGGSSIFDLARGINRIYPSVTMPTEGIRFWADVEDLGKNGYGFAVLIQHQDWPARLRRWSPAFRGGHWVYIEAYQAGSWRLLNPLGRGFPPYRGETASSVEMEMAARYYRTKNGVYTVAPVEEGSLLQTMATVTPLGAPRKFTIRPGIIFGWLLDPTTGSYAKSKTLTIPAQTTDILADATVLLEQYPKRNRSPYGQFVRLINGALAGHLVPVQFGTLDTAPAPTPPSCGELVDAAVKPYAERESALRTLFGVPA